MLMRRRLYFLLPDADSARHMLNEMLLARIEASHIHFLGRRGELPPDLPEAGVGQKTDLVHAAQLGLGIGAILGALAGVWAYLDSPSGLVLKQGVILGATLFGAFFGAWAASLVGAAVPNSKLKPFEQDIERGRTLMMVDVPFRRVQEISELVARRHPEALSRGFEPTIPAFP
jgi:hypothetical protein